MYRIRPTLVILMLSCLMTGEASAQGLIWSIPDAEGSWVRYEGTYTQVMHGAGIPDGDLTLNFTRHLTIKALGSEEAEFGGETTACRWVEIKTVTGPLKEGQIDAGPGGTRIYKVLVPVAALQRVQVDDDGVVRQGDGIVAAHFPVVRGYRKIGNEPAAPVEGGALEFYPALTLLQNYRELATIGTETASVTNQGVTQEIAVPQLQGESVSEDAFTRSTNTGKFLRANDPQVAFGMVQWEVTLQVEAKASTDARSEFQPLSSVTETMAVAERGEGAQSEIDAQ